MDLSLSVMIPLAHLVSVSISPGPIASLDFQGPHRTETPSSLPREGLPHMGDMAGWSPGMLEGQSL